MLFRSKDLSERFYTENYCSFANLFFISWFYSSKERISLFFVLLYSFNFLFSCSKPIILSEIYLGISLFYFSDNRAFNCYISNCNFLTKSADRLEIKLAFTFNFIYHIQFHTCFALSTNFNVFKVSSLFFDDGEIVPIKTVLVFPTNDSCSRRVSFDYLKMDKFLVSSFDSILITFPKVVKDRLIFFSSFKCSFVISSFLFIFYDPAKSHKFNFAL